MKKTFLSFMLFSTAAVQVFAQKEEQSFSKFYLRVGGTYALPAGSQTTLGSNYLNGTINSTQSYTTNQLVSEEATFDLKKVSFGTGGMATVAGGVMFNRNLGVELAVAIGVSPQKYDLDYAALANHTSPSGTYRINIKSTFYQKTSVILSPSVVLQTDGKKLNVYSRAGIAVPVMGKLINDVKYTEIQSGNPITYGEEYAYEYQTRFAIGFQGALGVQYRIDENFSIYLEANGMSLNAYAKKRTLTKFSVNGYDYLDQQSLGNKETEYEFNYNEKSPTNPNAPSKALAFSIPYSSLGFGLGFVVRL